MFEFLKGRIRRNRCLVSIITVFCLLLSLMAIPKPSVAAKNNFLAGSLIIPMDTTYQDMGMWKAYGLVYELLNQGILVSWAIEPNKTFNQSDFTAMTEDLRTGRSAGSHGYSGGPFIIDSADVDKAIPIIQAWWLNHENLPNVHKATSSFSPNVDIVLKNPPRIANEEVNASIAIPYYNAAGIPDLNGSVWSIDSPNILNQEEIANGGLFADGISPQRKFDVFVTADNSGYDYSMKDSTDLGTRTYAQFDYFVHQGGGWVAMGQSIRSNENAIVNLYQKSDSAVKSLFKATIPGGFLTENGFASMDNQGGTWTVTEPNLPVSQASATTSAVQTLPGDSIQTWGRNSVVYHAQTELVANFTDRLTGLANDWAINGVAHGGSTAGIATFLGGCSFDTGLPYSSNAQAPYLRFFYNALFFNGSAVAKLDIRTSKEEITQGQASRITIRLLNSGASIAKDIRNVSIELPAGLKPIEMLKGPVPAIVGNSTTGTILTWTDGLGDIPGNASALEFNVELMPSEIGEKNIAHFTADYGNLYGETFHADSIRSIKVLPAENLMISQMPQTQSPYQGQIITWDLTYSNPGDSDLENAIVETILPAAFTFQASDPEPQSIVRLADGTTRIQWNVGALEAGSDTGIISLTGYVSNEIAAYSDEESGLAQLADFSGSEMSNVAKAAYGYIGYPYVFGATGPSSFDCSGFIQYLYSTYAGIHLSRTTYTQVQEGYPVSVNQLQPGDLLFFSSGDGEVDHVGLYVGNGIYIHAASEDVGVILSNTSGSYFINSFVEARRVIN